MFRKFSLKSKLIIFAIIAVIAIGIIVREGINNRRTYPINNHKSSIKSIKSK